MYITPNNPRYSFLLGPVRLHIAHAVYSASKAFSASAGVRVGAASSRTSLLVIDAVHFPAHHDSRAVRFIAETTCSGPPSRNVKSL